MKLDNLKTAYTFDDITIVPQHSTIESRKRPDLSTKVKGFNYQTPIISAPMNTITEKDMLVVMAKLGGAGVLHRYMTAEEQINIFNASVGEISSLGITNPSNHIFVAIGQTGEQFNRAGQLYEEGIRRFCVDVANGHNNLCIRAVEMLKKNFPDVYLMAGNVCTYNGAYNLAQAGADCLRVGVGNGSMCSTRQVTGHGVPQATALDQCCAIKKHYPEVAILADGGIRKSSDVVKSLAIGADAVMIGSLISGTLEAPGELIEENGKLYKYYSGMASKEGRSKWFDRSKAGMVPEGVSKKIHFTGRSAEKVISDLCSSVKVGLSYSGANNIKELRERVEFRAVTGAGYIEGTPHGLNGGPR